MAKIFTFILLTFFVSQSSQLDLGSLCQDMWDKTGENLNVPLELKLKKQNSDIGPLLELTPTGKAKIDLSPVFKTFEALLSSPEDTSLQDKFFNAIMTEYGPMQEAYNYLKANHLITETVTEERFECMLRDMWFGRPGKGFLHVFVGEKKVNTSEFQGLHNWYQFYLEQQKKTITIDPTERDLIRFSSNREPNVMRLYFKWDFLKNFALYGTSMFVGTSPAFEFALFSVCSLASKAVEGEQKECTCKIQNSQLKLKVIQKAYGHGRVFTAYPIL